MELTPTQAAALQALANMAHDPLCPSCGHRRQDPKSDNGWCVKCDAARQRILDSKRRWWHENRGAGVGDGDDLS